LSDGFVLDDVQYQRPKDTDMRPTRQRRLAGETPAQAATICHPLLPTKYPNLLLFSIPQWRDDRSQSDQQEKIVELLRLIRIVLSSFFGVRNRASHEADFANINIVLLPFVAVFLAACIGAMIFGLVHLVAHSTSTLQGL
jgi:Protein of unknown function (DUF2970)